MCIRDRPCASCDGTKELFEIVSEELDDVSELYPYMVSVYNVFRKEDAQIRDSELKKLGFQEELAGSLTYPIMTVNGNIYFGTDSIRSSIREAYLTAGEDLFVYGRGCLLYTSIRLCFCSLLPCFLTAV